MRTGSSIVRSTITTVSTMWIVRSRIPLDEGSLDHLLYMKNWVDTVQWHLEDIIRDPQIDPVEALAIKRRIDKSNQVRTDMVAYIDSYLLDKYKAVVPQSDARLNTETPAWAIDRRSRFWR